MGVDGQDHAPAALPQDRDMLPIVQEGGLSQGNFLVRYENVTSTGIRSPDLPAHNE
jgi:hypothetical protein